MPSWQAGQIDKRPTGLARFSVAFPPPPPSLSPGLTVTILPGQPTNLLRLLVYVMPEFFESIPDHLIPWLLDQHVFWVASAPLSKDGHVNLSPKGLKGSFRVNNANEVWYEDLMGSGETQVHALRAMSADLGNPRH